MAGAKRSGHSKNMGGRSKKVSGRSKKVSGRSKKVGYRSRSHPGWCLGLLALVLLGVFQGNSSIADYASVAMSITPWRWSSLVECIPDSVAPRTCTERRRSGKACDLEGSLTCPLLLPDYANVSYSRKTQFAREIILL